MRAKDTVPMATRGGLDTVAVRCPVSPIANRLIALSGVPVAAPSANVSGSPSPTVATHVIDDMLGKVDMIIDGGECDIGLESTIVKIEDDSTLTLLRPGRITPDELSLVAELKIANAVADKLREGEVAISPGMKYRHYAPTAPLELLDGECEDAIEYISSDNLSRVAVLCYRDDEKTIRERLPRSELYVLGEREDEAEQAKHLFYLLREADKCKYDKIYAPLPSKRGVGLALYNRLIRAAAHTIIKLRR
jgi:L-threonylcarbamoyladenylate synthase